MTPRGSSPLCRRPDSRPSRCESASRRRQTQSEEAPCPCARCGPSGEGAGLRAIFGRSGPSGQAVTSRASAEAPATKRARAVSSGTFEDRHGLRSAVCNGCNGCNGRRRLRLRASYYASAAAALGVPSHASTPGARPCRYAYSTPPHHAVRAAPVEENVARDGGAAAGGDIASVGVAKSLIRRLRQMHL